MSPGLRIIWAKNYGLKTVVMGEGKISAFSILSPGPVITTSSIVSRARNRISCNGGIQKERRKINGETKEEKRK